jgi:hypothetical protein
MHAFTRLTAAGLLAAGLAAGAAATSGPALAAPPDPAGSGSAFGLASSGGPLGAVPPVPAVSSDAGPARKSLLNEDRLKAVSASALNVAAAPANARSNVADLAVPTAKLKAGAVTATCRDAQGGAHLTRATVAGKRLDATPPPNTTVPVDVEGVGRTSLVLNKQQRLPNGRLAVTAMQLNLPGGKGALRVASATCGREPAQRPAEAPAPKPVKHHDLPVTG